MSGVRTISSSSQVSDDLIKLYATACAFLILISCYLELGKYAFIQSSGFVLPKYIYYAICVSTFPIIAFSPSRFARYASAGFGLWSIALFLLNLIHCILLLLDGRSEMFDIASTRAQYALMSCAFGYIVLNAEMRPIKILIIGLTLLLCGMQFFDFMFPGVILPMGTEGTVVGRAASTLVNPNAAGESLALLTILSVFAIERRYRLVILLLAVAAIFVTFSRAATIWWALFVIFIVSRGELSRISISFLLFMSSLIYSYWFLIYSNISTSVDISAYRNIAGRMNFFWSFDTSDASAQQRLEVAGYAWDLFLNNPFFGAGAGYTSVWSVSDKSPHNESLLILSEYGLVGYILFGWLIYIIYANRRNGWGGMGVNLSYSFIISVIFFSMFTHNIFDSLYWLVSFAILCSSNNRLNIKKYNQMLYKL